ncbi:hypothetical protein ISN44_As08g034690 [Arabidopsis suecica]|uniref:Uncharacterized protein n=1 Tax=Arabidopsis suecica TaxID=45249 RepID=A0A8T2BA07_ARASU|nr:hypothetical protein ISN44_As08g034690 [Arabidopsis suecica]
MMTSEKHGRKWGMIIVYGHEVKTKAMIIQNKKVEESALKMGNKKARQQVRDSSDLIDASDSDDVTSNEGDDDDDIPTESWPNEASDKYIQKLF